MSQIVPPPRSYVLISPCRNEAEYMRRTLDSVVAQSETPTLWVIIDDGSTDETPQILAEYAAQHDWIRIVAKPDRGHRAVGPGVIEAFYYGIETINIEEFAYLCKLDLDLDLPPKYFSILMDRLEANPRIGTCSGKAYFRNSAGEMVSEGISDEMSLGMTKFFSVACFQDVGGFVREVMWDGIDCHKARKIGWTPRSWDEPDLRFDHLRPMGSSQTLARLNAAQQAYLFGWESSLTLSSQRKKKRSISPILRIIAGMAQARILRLEDPRVSKNLTRNLMTSPRRS